MKHHPPIDRPHASDPTAAASTGNQSRYITISLMRTPISTIPQALGFSFHSERAVLEPFIELECPPQPKQANQPIHLPIHQLFSGISSSLLTPHHGRRTLSTRRRGKPVSTKALALVILYYQHSIFISYKATPQPEDQTKVNPSALQTIFGGKLLVHSV